MAIPQPVVDVLNSFSIVTPVAGAQVPAATKLTPALNSDDPAAAINALNAEEVIAKLDLDITFDDIQLALSPATGATNLDLVLKAVEFPEPVESQASAVPVSAQAVGKLPHLIPAPATGVPPYVLGISSRVEGLLGTAEGTIKLVESVAGSLLGKITGEIKRKLLSVEASVELAWTVQDASGRDLTTTEVVNLGTGEAPVWVLLPAFVEFTGGPPTTTERRIFCTITVKVGGEQLVRTVGPVTIKMPEIPLPTLLVLTQHAVGDPMAPGMIVMIVPQDSAVGPLTNIDPILSPIATLFGALTPLLPAGSSALGAFTAAGAALARLRGLLNRTIFFTGDYGSGFYFGTWPFGTSFEDHASSLVMIGPPGRRVRLYNSRRDAWPPYNFVERFGAIDVAVGLTGIVDIADFTTGMPPTGSPSGFGAFDSPVTVVNAGGLTDFNDVLSAFRLVGAGEV